LPQDGGPEPNWLNTIARPGRKISGWFYRQIWLGLFVNAVGLVVGVLVWIPLLPILKLRDLRRRPWMA
jgi:hypothetical protein